MREIRLSGSEGGGAKPIVSPYPYLCEDGQLAVAANVNLPRASRGHLLIFDTVTAVSGLFKSSLQSNMPKNLRISPCTAMKKGSELSTNCRLWYFSIAETAVR